MYREKPKIKEVTKTSTRHCLLSTLWVQDPRRQSRRNQRKGFV